MKQHRDKILWAVVISEVSHVFCCGLPILFSALSLLTGLGVMSAMPGGLVAFHDWMHEYEVPMILFSALVLGLGWGLYFYAKKVDCHDTGCHHAPCTPRKKAASRILWIATALFAVNVSVYLGLHRGVELPSVAVHQGH